MSSAGVVKTVILVDAGLGPGLAANAASIAATMIAHAFPALMGPRTATSDGAVPGVVLTPLPILGASRDIMDATWQRLRTESPVGVHAFPFSHLAQSCRTYDEYIEKMASTSSAELTLAALGLYGPRKAINGLSGNLELYPAQPMVE
jgi:hypothetical protein